MIQTAHEKKNGVVVNVGPMMRGEKAAAGCL